MAHEDLSADALGILFDARGFKAEDFFGIEVRVFGLEAEAAAG